MAQRNKQEVKKKSTPRLKSHLLAERKNEVVQGADMAATSPRLRAVQLPEELVERTEQAASQREVDPSQLIQSAVDLYLAPDEPKVTEEELAAAYVELDQASRQVCEEFSSVDSENI